MEFMNRIQRQDICEFACNFTLSKNLRNSDILVTGATGLIGSTLVRCLLALNENIRICCPVRNKDKAISMYGETDSSLSFVESDLLEFTENLKGDFKYIIHCASPTDGKYMASNPVETYELSTDTTRNLLRYAKEHKDCSMVYISSLEYYGQIFEEKTITEDQQGYIDIKSPRSSYPLGKRSAEYLCRAYAMEYGVNVKTARLTQTFGAGVAANDNRVFAQFARSIISGNDIIMHTDGTSAKPYVYTTDCIRAILYILIKGKNGESYNVANDDTYISIKELAYFLRDEFNPSIKVRFEKNTEMKYAPTTKLKLSSEKLRQLGWKPLYGLKEMFERLINSIKE